MLHECFVETRYGDENFAFGSAFAAFQLDSPALAIALARSKMLFKKKEIQLLACYNE